MLEAGQPELADAVGTLSPALPRSGVAEGALGIVLAKQLLDRELNKLGVVLLEPDAKQDDLLERDGVAALAALAAGAGVAFSARRTGRASAGRGEARPYKHSKGY